jgi:AcrR family transcriptional regulator
MQGVAPRSIQTGSRAAEGDVEVVVQRVDQSARRRQIARVVARLWASSGSRGCTIRAVAKEIDASATVVTNAFGTSAAMLEYTLTWLLDSWEEAGDALLARDAPPAVLLKEFLAHQCPFEEIGIEDAHIWLDAIAPHDRPAWSSAAFSRYDAWLTDRVMRLLGECGADQSYAPVLLVTVFGLNAAAIQSPEAWPPERLSGTLDDVLQAVLGAAG